MTGDLQEADAAISAKEVHLDESDAVSVPVDSLLRAPLVWDFADEVWAGRSVVVFKSRSGGTRARRPGRLLRQAASLSHDPLYRGEASRPGGEWSSPDEESA